MPISRNAVFKCEKCGYKEVRKVGDVLPDKEMLKPCPKCGGVMTMLDEESISIFDKLKQLITKR